MTGSPWSERECYRKMKQILKKNINVPNLLSMLRIIVIVPLTKFLLDQDFIMAGVMVLISAVSDMLDGFLARKLNQITELGKVLDPIADKLTLIAIVLCMNYLYPEIMPFILILFIKEMLMLSGGAFLLKIKIRPPAARWFGKISTVIFYTSITSLILLKAIWGYTNITLSLVLLSVTTVSMLFSLVMYTIMFVKLVKEKNKETLHPENDGEEKKKDLRDQ